MEPIRGSLRRLASLIALGCLLGAATAAGTTFISAAPAPADIPCGYSHANVEGGRSTYKYGAGGSLYVNTQNTVNAYSDAFVRSFAVIVDSNNLVEVGWSAHSSGTTSPQAFAEWFNAGVRGYKNYKLVTYDTDYGFIVDNVGHVEIFRFYFNGESSAFAYSPTMAFDTGQPIGNAERNNWCESLWAHMHVLSDQNSDGSWETWDGWDWCLNTTQSGLNQYFMHRDSDTELHVTNDSTGKLC